MGAAVREVTGLGVVALVGDEGEVVGLVLDEFVVGALLLEEAVSEDAYFVGVPDGGEAVGDDEGGAFRVREEGVEGGLDLSLIHI